MTESEWDDELPGDLRALLADPAFWEDPSPETELAVLALIADAAAAAASAPPAPASIDQPIPVAPRANATVTHLESARSRRRVLSPLALAAAVAVLAGAVGLGFAAGRSGDDDTTAVASATFGGTVVAESGDLDGQVRLGRSDSGWRIDLQVTGLPRRADGDFYEAWLKDADGVLVSIGTFNEGADVVLWAGVSPELFTTLTITRETADGDPTSSGDLVVAVPLRALDS